jgi:predicted metal-dependent hydrolase
MARTTTPDDLTIHPREIAFGREEGFPRWWHGNDPVPTAFYNALSVTFPLGERFFMDAVRYYKKQTPKALQAQITAFVSQEAMHSREHVFFNRQVTSHGYDITAMEARVKFRTTIARKLPHAMQLAATAALEHFTAIMAHAILSNPAHMEGVTEEARRMWRWHAMEEIEHKAVAFDTLIAAVKGGPLGRWALRSWAMFVTTLLFTYTITRNVWEFFDQDGINTPRTWGRLLGYLWGKPGLLRAVAGSYLSYYRPGFHPWQEDDRALIAAMQAEYA